MGDQRPIRYQGEVVEWSDEKRCGFIRPRGAKPSDPLVFIGAASMATKKKLPSVGHVLTYELSELPRTQKNLRLRTLLRAENAAFLGEELQLETNRSKESVYIRYGIEYLGALAILGIFRSFWHIVLAATALSSVILFLVYWLDKNAAESDLRRVPETTLQAWAFLGGWPGAAIAQKVFRHKTRKASFQITFRIMIALNVLVTVAAVAVWLRMPDAAVLRHIFG